MTTILTAMIIFLQLIFYIVVFDIILSWLTLLGIRFRPQFIQSILNPLYSWVRKFIPTRFGAFDFTPIIIIFAITFLINLIVSLSPEVSQILNSIVL